MSMIVSFSYVVSSVLFITGLKMLGSAETARKGNFISAIGMLIAIVFTLLDQGIVSYFWIIVGLIVGGGIGYYYALKVEMTQMPEMVALFNGFGGLASLFVGWAAIYEGGLTPFVLFTVALTILIGGVTFSGSMVAWGKLNGKIEGKAIVFDMQRSVNIALLAVILLSSTFFIMDGSEGTTFWLVMLVILSLVLGVLAVIPIGGADMPVVISLLNSYSGVAACAAGFAINNNVLIVAGSLVGASGIILTQIMCKAMNRSLTNVLFSGFGEIKQQKAIEGEAKPISAEDAYYILEASNSVVFVPGYGMAVAQAQHAVRELAKLLEQNGAEVSFAIHPVAGRMPGHMNVLLAEADVPYDQLVEMDDINPRMDSVDTVIVIGANDVVNPSATNDESSPIYGMPVIEVTRAKTVIVLKRSMASGFSGVDNPLFFEENTRMLFGDAKESVGQLVRQFA
jgi:NAD(P) transhydrogenase subunit beta